MVHEWVCATVVLCIVVVSAVLTSLQEYGALNAVNRLRRRFSPTTTVLRDCAPSTVAAVGVASDNVEREWERTPHRWSLGLLRNFMIIFGLVSTVFDLPPLACRGI